jgi:RNase P protein component
MLFRLNIIFLFSVYFIEQFTFDNFIIIWDILRYWIRNLDSILFEKPLSLDCTRSLLINISMILVLLSTCSLNKPFRRKGLTVLKYFMGVHREFILHRFKSIWANLRLNKLISLDIVVSCSKLIIIILLLCRNLIIKTFDGVFIVWIWIFINL